MCARCKCIESTSVTKLNQISLPSGFPRQSGTWVEIGGVRSAFSMPEVTSFGLGGGTKVYDYNGDIVVGPESVGHFLTSKALVFGGDTLTASGKLDQRNSQWQN